MKGSLILYDCEDSDEVIVTRPLDSSTPCPKSWEMLYSNSHLKNYDAAVLRQFLGHVSLAVDLHIKSLISDSFDIDRS